MAGYIKIYTDIQKHWIWQNPVWLKWWIDILVTVNWEENKVVIGGKMYEVGRGQTVMSMLNWSKRWRCSIGRVIRFFQYLQDERMIDINTDNKTTHLTVCNYDKYQGGRKTNGKQTENKRKQYNNIYNKPPISPLEGELSWRDDFNIYLREGRKAFDVLTNDPAFEKAVLLLYPNADVQKSLIRAWTSYWGTQDAWEKRKKGKALTINWKATLMKTIGYNIVEKR